MTLVLTSVAAPDASQVITDTIIGPIKNLRGWAFVFTFLCIGLTTRFKDLAAVGSKPILAFSLGVAVNVVLGYLFSVLILGDYWTSVANMIGG